MTTIKPDSVDVIEALRAERDALKAENARLHQVVSAFIEGAKATLREWGEQRTEIEEKERAVGGEGKTNAEYLADLKAQRGVRGPS